MLGVPGMMSELPVGAAMVPGKLRSSTEASEARFASQPVVGAPGQGYRRLGLGLGLGLRFGFGLALGLGLGLARSSARRRWV